MAAGPRLHFCWQASRQGWLEEKICETNVANPTHLDAFLFLRNFALDGRRVISILPATMNSSSNLHSRRTFLVTSAGAAAGLALSQFDVFAADPAPAAPTGPFKLDKLPYAFDALEPSIDAKTMEIHHGKHHASYVTKLNEAVAGMKDVPAEVGTLISDLSKLPEKSQMAVRNQGGGHYNHTLFWSLLGKSGASGVGGEASGKIGPALVKEFGSFKGFQEKFAEAATKRFGSGWAWLIVKPDGSLAVTSTANQDSPIMKGIVPAAEVGTPILGLDVWEHAYYLKYQNKRPDYIAAWWNVVNWSQVDELLAAAKK